MPTDQGAGLRSLICALFLVLSIFESETPALGQDRQTVDLELVLLIDVSASVSKQEFRLQIEGLAGAFRNPIIQESIQASGGIAVCVVQWAQEAYQYKSVDWIHLRQDTDALKLAKQIASIPRQTPSGQTAIGNALIFALVELNTNSYTGLRRVIDLSGDGRSNDGLLLEQARETVLLDGITINGLAILNEVSDLKKYFRNDLIGGYGAFVLTARDYTDFSRAIREKLEREIRSTPVASNTNSGASVKAHVGVASQFGSDSVR
ncbi:MAG: DUF1194 domain-containing protein [Roseobacter sp.]